MKLRNKKTGKIQEIVVMPVIGGYPDETVLVDGETSLKEFNKVWEDYESRDPLIKDDKIRKAVRSWAEANGIDGCVCKEEIHCITFETERGMFISFENADYIPPEGNFTIAELCGEEEE